MLASVLRTSVAVGVSVQVVRAFVRFRELLAAHEELARKLEALEVRLVEHDEHLAVVFEAIRSLMQPPGESRKPPICFEGRKEK